MPAAQIGVAKSDFSQMCRSRSVLIENAERFTRIDLDLSDFEKERTQLLTRPYALCPPLRIGMVPFTACS